MNPEEFQRVSELVVALHALPLHERDAWLQRECGAQSRLLTEVKSLLAAEGSGPSMLTYPDSLLAYGVSGINRLLAAPSELEPSNHPDHIGHFEILGLIGQGGMGTVYKARQKNPQRVVALKVIRGGWSSVQTRKRFEMEAHVLGQLLHPGIAQIFEGGTVESAQGPLPFFAMELVDGQSLTDYFKGRGPAIRDRVMLLRDIALTVHHAHQKSIVHRDLKPANILVTLDGRPKILDFGVARLLENPEGDPTVQTEAGALMGTLPYMSPEQVAGRPEDIDTRADIYSLGVIGYELLSGRKPLDAAGKSISEAIRMITEMEPPALGSIQTEARGDLEAIVHKALEKDARRRYASASELALDLDRYLGDLPVQARKAGTIYHARKFMARHSLTVALCATLFVSVTALAVVAIVQAQRANDQRDRARLAQQQADHRFDQVRQLANTFMFDLHDQIARLPGSTAARQSLVTTAIEYLDSLAAETPDDAGLLFELAQGYRRVSAVQGGNRTANLGDIEGATTTLEKSLSIFENLLEMDPEKLSYRLDLAEVCMDLGALAYRRSQYGELNQYFNRAGSIIEQLIESDPDNADLRYLEYRYTLAYYDPKYHQPKPGIYALLLGKLEWVSLGLEAILVDAPENKAYLRSLIACQSNLGDLHAGLLEPYEVVDREKALFHYERAMNLSEELLISEPNNPLSLRSMMIAMSRMGELSLANGALEDAAHELESALQEARALMAADALDQSVRHDFSSMAERLAQTLSKLNRLEEAVIIQRESIAVRQRLVDAFPENSGYFKGLGMLWFRLGSLYDRLGQTAGVVEATQQALTCWRSDVVFDSLGQDSVGVMAMASQRLVQAQLALDDVSGAIQSCRDQLGHTATITQRIPNNSAANLSWAEGCARFGDFILSTGIAGTESDAEREALHEEACGVLAQGLEMLDVLAASDAKTVATETRRELIDLLENCDKPSERAASD